MSYPQEPTARNGSAQTAFDAAELVKPKAAKMMDRVERYIIDHGPASPEEITHAIREPDEHLLLTSIRARVCQLHKLGRVKDSGERGVGESLRSRVIRWRASTPEERSLWAAQRALAEERGEQADG